MAERKDQRHPQYTKDRQVVNEMLSAVTPTERHIADLARLCIRYDGFPGARDIQRDLEKLTTQWGFTIETLYAKTRGIHQIGKVFISQDEGQEDWA